MAQDIQATVIEAARSGAEWAWLELYRAVAPDLLRYGRAQNWPDPEDIVGEVMVSVVRKLAEFDGDGADFRAWVFTIAHNRAKDLWRRNARRREDAGDESAWATLADCRHPEQLVVESFSQQEVRLLLDALPPLQRDVVLLRVIAGFSVEETSAVTGRSPGAVKSLQFRALSALRRRISTKAVSKWTSETLTSTR